MRIKAAVSGADALERRLARLAGMDGLEAVLLEAADAVREAAGEGLREGSGEGEGSRAGEDEGAAIAASLEVSVRSDRPGVTLGSALAVAWHREFGRLGGAERPWLLPALARALPNINHDLGKLLRSWVSGRRAGR